MIRLFLLYAILIFAKKAPKLITDLLNIKSEGTGLKGLSIKNKMGEAALVGDKVKKGMMGVEGGLKKAGGAARQTLKNALINPNGVAGKIGGDIKSGWKDGWNNGKEDGKGFFGKLGGALSSTGKAAKKTIWDERKENKKDYRDQLNDALIKNAKVNVKKVVANLEQGADEYRKKENTKGAYTQGRKNIDVNFMTAKERFENFAGNTTRAVTKWAELDDEKAAKSRYDRSVLGLDVGVSSDKVKIKPETFGSDEVFNNLVQQWDDESWHVNYTAFDNFKKSDEYKSWGKEKQLTFEKYFNGYVHEDLVQYKAINDKMIELAGSINSAKSAGLDSTEFEDAYNSLAAKLTEFKNLNYKYNGQAVDLSNIDNAINKAAEDASKSAQDLAALKEAQKPKDNK